MNSNEVALAFQEFMKGMLFVNDVRCEIIENKFQISFYKKAYKRLDYTINITQENEAIIVEYTNQLGDSVRTRKNSIPIDDYERLYNLLNVTLRRVISDFDRIQHELG
jgi:hypothetical protein